MNNDRINYGDGTLEGEIAQAVNDGFFEIDKNAATVKEEVASITRKVIERLQILKIVPRATLK